MKPKYHGGDAISQPDRGTPDRFAGGFVFAVGHVSARHLHVVTGHPYLMTGGSSKVWYGGGDGTVHSSPGASSQTCAVARLAAADALDDDVHEQELR